MINWLKKQSKWVTRFIFGTALIAVYKTFDTLISLRPAISAIGDAVKPFAIAFAVAYLLNIPVKKLTSVLERKIKYRRIKKNAYGISIAVVYLIFVAAFAVTLSTLLPAIYKNILEMYNNLPMFVDAVVDFVNNSEIADKFDIKINRTLLDNNLQSFFAMFDINSLGKYAQGIISFTSGFVDIFIALIASVYMLIDRDRIISGSQCVIKMLLGEKRGTTFSQQCTNVNSIFTKYVYSRLVCCVVMAVACSLILGIMGEKYALLLGIFIGFMDLIPYFGSIISWCISAVVMIVSGGPFHALWCSLVMLVMQQIDGNILAPRITGNKLDIRPLTIIIAVSVGGTLFGFVGMLISVPVVTVLRGILFEALSARSKKINEEK